MLRSRFFRKFYSRILAGIDQTKIVYVLSLVVGLLSALAAAVLKNAIHYTNKILTEGITPESGSYFYLAYPVIGMFITLLFVRYIVKDNIGHGVSRVLYAISKKKSRLRRHNTWTSLVATTLTIGFGGSVGAEAPIVLTGSSIGSTIGRYFKLNYRNVTLAARGELITHDKDKAVLTMMDWRREIERDLIKVRSADTLGELVKIISRSKRNIFPVVDEYNILEGVVLLDDVREIMFNSELYDTTTVRDLMTIPPSYLDLSESIETVMETFEKTDAWNLPVLDKGFYVGFISKSRIYATYRELLVQFSEE
jgi:CBS domain-containing protein